MANYVKVGVESTFGTHVTTTGINATSVSDDVDRSILIEERIDNYIAAAGYGGPLKISGTIEGTIRPKQLGLLLQACFGDSASPYTLGIPKSLSIDIGDEILNKETQYNGCGISKLSFNFVAKDFATFTADWFAKNFTIATFTEPTITAEDPAVFYHAKVSLDAVESTEIKEMTMDIDRKLDEDNFVLGDFTIHRLARTGVTDISGSITFSEAAIEQMVLARTGSTTGTAIDANNTLGDVALVITCTTMAGVTSMVITAPIALYGKSGRKIDKVSEIERTVDYKIIGAGFQIEVS